MGQHGDAAVRIHEFIMRIELINGLYFMDGDFAAPEIYDLRNRRRIADDAPAFIFARLDEPVYLALVGIAENHPAVADKNMSGVFPAERHDPAEAVRLPFLKLFRLERISHISAAAHERHP